MFEPCQPKYDWGQKVVAGVDLYQEEGMSAPAQRRAGMTSNPLQPNDVDRKRIERALAQRMRYRYVSPLVRSTADGYRIESPCCSRNIDRSGGVIDIALLRYRSESGAWQLYRKDHDQEQWVLDGEYGTLTAVLARLNTDPERLFWQ